MLSTVSSMTSVFVALGIILITKWVYDALIRISPGARLPYPPGPKTMPFIGNALDLPTQDVARVFAEWSKKFKSGILHASAFGVHVVVINSRKIAEELIEGRPEIYNDRPVLPIVDLTGWGCNVALMRYGDVWRQHRKLCQQNFNANAARQYHQIQLERVHNFLYSVLHDPEQVFDHSSLLSISTAMMMMYGYAPTSLNDPVIRLAEEGTKLLAALTGFGGTLINIFPILRYFPPYKKDVKRFQEVTKKTKRMPMDHAKAALLQGTAVPSLVTEFLEKKATAGASSEEESIVANVAWTIYGAASDTTISASGTFAINPEIQRRAQEELDSVVGNDRLPDFNDRPHLPYVDAIYHEVLRFAPPANIGAPHALMEDDTYEGYFLPKGSIVTANIWAMTHDESIYPEPHLFIPERYLDFNGKLKDDSRILSYGFGRRLCVGKAVGSDFLWLTIASFLACFNIKKARDEAGREIEIEDTYSRDVLTRKLPFKCSIQPRSEQIRMLIESTRDR